jgi:hypothetical protein
VICKEKRKGVSREFDLDEVNAKILANSSACGNVMK